MTHPGALPPNVEIAFGYGTYDAVPSDGWTDVTDHLAVSRAGAAVTTRSGRSRSGISPIQPGAATVQLENHDGRFDPRNADGPFFGDLKNGVPIRITTGEGGSYLSQVSASNNRIQIATSVSVATSVHVDARIRSDFDDDDPSWDRVLAVGTNSGGDTLWAVAWTKAGPTDPALITVVYVKADASAYQVYVDIADLGITPGEWADLEVDMTASAITITGPGGVGTPTSTSGTPGTITTDTISTVHLMSFGGLSTRGFAGDLASFELTIDGFPEADLNLGAAADSADTAWNDSYGNAVTRSTSSSPALLADSSAGRWTGWVNSGWPQQFTERLPVVTITAHDLFGLLARSDPPTSAFDATVAAHSVAPSHRWVPGPGGWVDAVTGLTGRHTGALAALDPTVVGGGDSFGQLEPDGWGVVEHPDAWLSAADESIVIACRFRLIAAATRAATTDPAGEVAYPVALLWQSEVVDSPPVGIVVWPDYLQVNVNDDVAQRLASTATTVALMDGREHSILVHVPESTGDIEVWLDGIPLRIDTIESAYATTIVPGPLYLGSVGPSPFLEYPHQGAIDPIIVWRDHPGTGLADLAADLHATATIGWAGQRLDERLRSIVEGMGAGSMIGALDVSGIATQQSYRQRPVLELFQTIEDTEQGRIWVDRTGQLRFSQRGWSWTDPESTAIQATFSDDETALAAGAIEILPETVLNDSPLDLINIAKVSSANGRQQVATDQASIDLYGGQRRAVQLSNLLHPSDRQSLSIAEWIIYSQSTAPVRIERISFAVEPDPDVTIPIAQAIEEGWLVRLIKAPRVDTAGAPIGDPIDVQGHVVGVDVTWSFGRCVVTLTVMCTRAGQDWFRADDSTTDGPDVAAF